MELRQRWERNSVLAEAFCQADERVVATQTSLDEAQATRTRLLAAMSVTVGSDGAVADLLGLAEREVRLARRTVGRAEARQTAAEMLADGAAYQSAPPQESEPPQVELGAPQPPESPQQQPPPAEAVMPETAYPHVVQTPPQPPPEAWWSPALDALISSGWQAGVDPQLLADEVGCDLRTLILRVQELSMNNFGNVQDPGPDYWRRQSSGRHRRLRAADRQQFAHGDGLYLVPPLYNNFGDDVSYAVS